MIRRRARLAALLLPMTLLSAGPARAQAANAGDAATLTDVHAALATPGFIATDWYLPFPPPQSAATTPANSGSGVAVCNYGVLLRKMTIGALGAYVKVGSAATNAQLAIYQNGSWGRPGTLIDKTASIATTSSTTFVSGALGANQQLARGGYWFCVNLDNATVTLQGAQASGGPGPVVLGSSNGALVANTGNPILAVKVSQTYGTWPNWTSGTAWSDSGSALMPSIAFQVVSVP